MTIWIKHSSKLGHGIDYAQHKQEAYIPAEWCSSCQQPSQHGDILDYLQLLMEQRAEGVKKSDEEY